MSKPLLRKQERPAAGFLLLGLILSAAYLVMCHVYGRTPEMRLCRCIFKGFINLCWLAAAFIASRRSPDRLNRKILLALVFYSIGDVLAPANFLVGGAAFAVGHLVITGGYLRQYGMSRRQWGVLAAVSAGMIAILTLSLGADWRLPFFALYLIVLVTMDVAAFPCRYYFVTVNVFLLSDVLAYIRKLFFNWDWFHDVTLMVYYAAILLYCFSFRVLNQENDE